MSLPTDPKTPWPPEEWADVYADYEEWAAWYSGDPLRLSDVYSRRVATPTPRGMFWARDIMEERRVMLHVPIAGDIAALSAALLFSEPPTVTVPEAHGDRAPADAKATQARLEELLEKNYMRLLEAAETCAAMGGVFLRPTWDLELADYPLLTPAQPDNAVPEFRFGILRAVTFWRVIADDGKRVIRHLERHEPGVIYHGLYEGTDDQLGRRIPLTSHPETAGLQEEIRTQGFYVRYVPNRLPNRKHRGLPIGMSDYSGIEGLMDALDEVYTSWVRDIRLGQSRLFIPETLIDQTGNFDLDREAYVIVNPDPLNAQAAKIEPVQFAIRCDEHMRTALELMDRIVTAAGYSPQSFGLKIENRAESGRALMIRERKTFVTRGIKERYWRPALSDVMQAMLMIDRDVFGTDVNPEYRPNVVLSDSVMFDLAEVSASIDLLNRARAISIETAVRLAHPDWTEEQVQAEVERIYREQGITVPDPMQAGVLP